MGVASGYFLIIITYPYSSCICSFAAASLLFVNLKYVFRSCSDIYFLVIKFYVLTHFPQYTHT